MSSHLRSEVIESLLFESLLSIALDDVRVRLRGPDEVTNEAEREEKVLGKGASVRIKINRLLLKRTD